MLAAEAYGLATCPQEAWAKVRRTLHEHLQLSEEEMIYCGIALGRADEAHASAAMVRERATLDEIVDFRGI
jgi:nitroreductase